MSSPAILCVDDEGIILRSLKDQLRRAFGRELLVETAESGDEGLQVFDELVEDGLDVPVVISDQLMPGMKGEEFLAQVHARDPRVLNILLTGQATVDAVGAAVNRGRLYRYIAKPWDETDLLLTVREARRAWDQARAVERAHAELEAAHRAALRFVPAEVLALIGRQRVSDVSFGDHVERDIHVFLSDMRRFTTLIEALSAGDAFAFLNDYFGRIEREVRAAGGFAVSTKGDQLLALFPGAVEGALQAGVAAFKALDAWNEQRLQRGEPRVNMGLGINSGPLLMGTIGSDERLGVDLVGDVVNLAARVESATKQYGTRMLVTDAALAHAEGGLGLRLREVDRVVAVGFTAPMVLHEVLDALPSEQAQRRLAHDERLQRGRAALAAADLDGAEECLRGVLDADPEDGPARRLLQRVARFRREGVPEGWRGVATLTSK